MACQGCEDAPVGMTVKHDIGCQFAATAVLNAIENHVASGIDTYVFMRFKEGYEHQASKDMAISEAVEDAADWLGLDSYTPPDLMPDPTAITSSDLKTMVMQEDE